MRVARTSESARAKPGDCREGGAVRHECKILNQPEQFRSLIHPFQEEALAPSPIAEPGASICRLRITRNVGSQSVKKSGQLGEPGQFSSTPMFANPAPRNPRLEQAAEGVGLSSDSATIQEKGCEVSPELTPSPSRVVETTCWQACSKTGWIARENRAGSYSFCCWTPFHLQVSPW